MQGGQFILNLVDFFGPQSIAFVLAIAEMVAVCWIYGKFTGQGFGMQLRSKHLIHIELIAPQVLIDCAEIRNLWLDAIPVGTGERVGVF